MNSEANLASPPHELLPRGHFPDIHYFMPLDMSEKKQKELIKWHEEQKVAYKDQNKQWDLRQNLIDYCRQDVKVNS